MVRRCAPERRAAILEAAERLLRHYGPTKTTVADIAREASVAVGSVYNDFANKDAILEALSWDRYEAVLAPMQAAADGGGDAASRVEALLGARTEGFLAFNADGAHGADLLHCGCSGVQGAADRFRVAEWELLRDVLAAGAQEGELELDDPGRAAFAVLAAHSPLTPPWLSSVAPEEARSLAADLATLLVHGLRAR